MHTHFCGRIGDEHIVIQASTRTSKQSKKSQMGAQIKPQKEEIAKENNFIISHESQSQSQREKGRCRIKN